MKKLCPFLIFFLTMLFSCQPVDPHFSQKDSNPDLYIPDLDLGVLFKDVQSSDIFPDYKTFVDCRPLQSPDQILASYLNKKEEPSFDLSTFVNNHFELPVVFQIPDSFHFPRDMETHLHQHWDYLTRSTPEQDSFSTAIALPYPYVVPGGRFREMFYWDSYFILLGLLESNRDDLALGILKNFQYLIDKFGYIPNGNRTYFLTRSQPPLFAAGLQAYAEKKGIDSILPFLPALEKEYEFWMRGKNLIKRNDTSAERVVAVEDKQFLNRYYGARDVARAEAFGKEMRWAQEKNPEERPNYFRHLRATCESGWDFSSRWFRNPGKKSTCHTMDIIPVCLNSLLFNLEQLLSQLYKETEEEEKSIFYAQKAAQRKQLADTFLWDEKKKCYKDYDFIVNEPTSAQTLAIAYPLYVKMASEEQAKAIAQIIEQDFLFPGGVVTTLGPEAEQWDYPNGWAPLQWITIQGLLNYGHEELAMEIARRWLAVNRGVYEQDRKMMEKYHVVQPDRPAGGGEYPNQDGFGWTNAIALKCAALLKPE